MVKIVHLTSVHPVRDVRIQKECQTLARAGYDVTLIAPGERDESEQQVQIQVVPKPRNRVQRMVCTSWYVYKRARGAKADLYHIHDPELLIWAQLLRLTGAEVIYDMHENVPGAILFKSWLPLFVRTGISRVYRFLERFLVSGLTVVFAETLYRDLYPWIKNSTTVLNMPLVDWLIRIHEPKYATPTLGYIGAVSPIRGSLVTLEVLHHLKQNGRTVNYECIGPITSQHQREISLHIAHYGLEEVNVRGYMPSTEGWPIIARCHIGIAILKSTPNSIVSYPTKMFEYMALGLPVIVSDFPLYRRVVEEEQCGLCVDPEDPVAIAKAVSWLLDHPDEARAMGARGRQAVLARYNWEAQARRLVTLYADLLKVAE